MNLDLIENLRLGLLKLLHFTKTSPKIGRCQPGYLITIMRAWSALVAGENCLHGMLGEVRVLITYTRWFTHVGCQLKNLHTCVTVLYTAFPISQLNDQYTAKHSLDFPPSITAFLNRHSCFACCKNISLGQSVIDCDLARHVAQGWLI